MANFWDKLKNLFGEAEASSPAKPAVHELIRRSPEEQADYEQWKTSLVMRRLRDWLANQYAVYRVLPRDIDEALDFIQTDSTGGFAIHFYKTNYTRREVTHFFDFLKEQVLSLGYRTQVSDVRTYNRDNWVETTERHYLKPRPNFEAGRKSDQRFGNITIELELRNDQVHNLRFRATIYQDRQYHEAEEFQELMQAILV